jgi:hypothetical protein
MDYKKTEKIYKELLKKTKDEQEKGLEENNRCSEELEIIERVAEETFEKEQREIPSYWKFMRDRLNKLATEIKVNDETGETNRRC